MFSFCDGHKSSHFTHAVFCISILRGLCVLNLQIHCWVVGLQYSNTCQCQLPFTNVRRYSPSACPPEQVFFFFLSLVIVLWISYFQCCWFCGLDIYLYNSFSPQMYPSTLTPACYPHYFRLLLLALLLISFLLGAYLSCILGSRAIYLFLLNTLHSYIQLCCMAQINEIILSLAFFWHTLLNMISFSSSQVAANSLTS